MPEPAKRPFYLVAHRINDPDGIGDAVRAGANAIECDVRENVVDHDGSFPWSTKLTRWLDAAAVAARDLPSLALLYFDVKEPSALSVIVDKVRSKIPEQFNVLYSIARFDDRHRFSSIVTSLRSHEGIAIDQHDDPDAVANYFASIGAQRCWYGNGIFVAGPPWTLPGIEQSIRRAVSIRDSTNRLAKVVVWTLEKGDSMSNFIGIGVDAILVARHAIPTLSSALQASSSARIARRDDPAFGHS